MATQLTLSLLGRSFDPSRRGVGYEIEWIKCEISDRHSLILAVFVARPHLPRFRWRVEQLAAVMLSGKGTLGGS
jgi:hypothetical protein